MGLGATQLKHKLLFIDYKVEIDGQYSGFSFAYIEVLVRIN
jgi:hypothetical protein